MRKGLLGALALPPTPSYSATKHFLAVQINSFLKYKSLLSNED